MPTTRRHLLTAALGTLALGGCNTRPPLLRIGTHPWLGYEWLHLAETRRQWDPQEARLVEMPTAAGCLRGLAIGTLEGACMTLDEYMRARARGIELVVVAVLDQSLGADALIATPSIRQLGDLKDRRIGLDTDTNSPVLLDAALQAAGLSFRDVRLVELPLAEQELAFMEGWVDAIATFEPTLSRLTQMGGHSLFSSRQMPGEIIDLLAVRPHVIGHQEAALHKVVAGHFDALKQWRRDPQATTAWLGERLRLGPGDLRRAMQGLEWLGVEANAQLLQGQPATLDIAAERLLRRLQRTGQMHALPPLSAWRTAHYLPEA